MSSEAQRIRRIEAFPLAYHEPHYHGMERCVTLVRIESDDGAVGWGEAISQFREASGATKVLVEDGFTPLLEGESPLAVERLWRRMCEHAYWYGVEGIAAFAISAIDMALWDLKGKLSWRPVAELLRPMNADAPPPAGADAARLPRAGIPAMGSIIFDMEDLDWTLSEFQAMRDDGYRIVKAGWGMRPEAVFGQDGARDLEYLTEVRGVIGEDLSLVVDTPGVRRLWDLETAIRRLREWETFGLRWVEQPLPPADLSDYSRLRAAVSVPVGAGEDEWSPETYGRVIDAQCVDVLQLDPGRCLGLTGCLRTIEQVEAAGIKYSAHSWSGALNTAASLAFLAISPNGDTLDFKPHESPMQHDLVDDPWVQSGGVLELRREPGLGVSVREEAVRRYGFG